MRILLLNLLLYIPLSHLISIPIANTDNTMTDFFKAEMKNIIKATLSSMPEDSLEKSNFASIYAPDSISESELLKSKEAYEKLIRHFAFESGDLSAYEECSDKNFKYIIGTIFIPIIRKASLTSILFQLVENKYTFGFCIEQSVYHESFIKEFLIETNIQTSNLIYENLTNDSLILTDYSSIQKEVRATAMNAFSLFLIVLFFFQIIVSSIVSLLAWLKCSFLNDNSCFIQILDAYNIKKALEILFDPSSKTKIYRSNSTLTYVNGLRGISMILFLCGSMIVNITLLSSPIIPNKETYFKMINGLFFSILILGIRHCSHIFLSCSGFSFFVKYYLYLDECCVKYEEDPFVRSKSIEFALFAIEDDYEGKEKDNKINAKDIRAKKLHTNDNANPLNEFAELYLQKDDTLLNIKYSLRFFFSHFHKYILLLLSVFFLRYLLYHIVKATPAFILWYKDTLTSINITDIIGHLLLYQSFFIEQTTERQRCILDYFWVPLSEVLYFTLFTPIFYVIYKKKLKSPMIIIILYALFFIAKIVVFCLINKSNEISNTVMLTALNQNPLLNTPFFLIGMLFGVFNYAIQKGMDYDDVMEGDKGSFITAVFITQRLRQWRYISVMYIIVTLIIIVIVFINVIITQSVTDIKMLDNAWWLNVIHYICIDLLALLVHLMFFTMYIRGEHFFTDFLSANYWSKFNRHYFNFLLLIPIVSLFILFMSESRISIDYPTMLINIFLLAVVMSLYVIAFYLFIEYPIKIFAKLVVNKIFKTK